MIAVTGISDGNKDDDRLVVFLKVTHLEKEYDWFIRIPPNTLDWREYVNLQESAILADIEKKEQEWELVKDTVKYETESLTGQQFEVRPTRDDIVRPTYPDYYILRKQEYPSLAEQMDAYWKGGDSLAEMQDKILGIKQKYPKQ